MTSTSGRQIFASGLIGGLSLTLGWWCAPVSAQDNSGLVERINTYRASPGKCSGTRLPPAGALTQVEVLSKIKLVPGANLQQALKNAGYAAARAEAILLTGPSNPDVVMAAIRDRYCRVLSAPEYSAIGISHDGASWRIILAKPLLATDLEDTSTAGRQVLKLINAARRQPRNCGNKKFSAAPALTWNEALARAALAHSSDMANRNYVRHEGKDGSTAGDRAQRAGYHWSRIGENIAAGQGSAQEAVAGWLSSPGHCANIMNPGFAEMGAAYAIDRNSDMSIYWTQVFGKQR